jgi:transposase
MALKSPWILLLRVFLLQVANMIVEQGVSVSQVCKDMKLAESAVRRWVAQLQSEQGGPPGIGKPLTAEQIRIRVLGVSRAGFYPAQQRLRQPVTLCAASVHLQAAFSASGK